MRWIDDIPIPEPEDLMTMSDDKVDEIWDRMDDNERFGVRFGLFPSWIEEYEPTKDDHVALIDKTREGAA